MSGTGRALRASLGAVIFVTVVWFLLLLSIVANKVSDKAATRISSTRNLSVLTVVAGGSHYLPRPPSYISVGKRRVPNGPDPIHNRRTRTSRFPPRRVL